MGDTSGRVPAPFPRAAYCAHSPQCASTGPRARIAPNSLPATPVSTARDLSFPLVPTPLLPKGPYTEHTVRMVGKLVAIFGAGLIGIIGCSAGDECQDGRTKQRICVECGPAGGCAKHADECVQSCGTHTDCEDVGPGFACVEGVCQIGFCI
jgi:hypothetical protein